MQLAATVAGTPGSHPPLLIAHGLFGSARNWGAIARRLARDRLVVAVDMRNHGDSPRSPEHGYAAFTVPDFDAFMLRAVPELHVPEIQKRKRKDD